MKINIEPHDLTNRLPHEDGTVEEISCILMLQKVNQDQRDRFMQECHRVLQPAGKLQIIVPYFKSGLSIADTETKQPLFHEGSFLKYGDLFDQEAGYNFTEESWANKSEEARNFAIKHYWDVVASITLNMTKK